MFGSFRNQALRVFSDQFESEGAGIVYRLNQTGAPIRVSQEERDRFVAAFDRAYQYLLWGFGLCVSMVMLGLVVAAAASGRPLSTAHVYAATAVWIGLLLASTWWIWNAPARALRGRMTAGKAYSKSDVRRRVLTRTPYRNFIVAAGAVGVLYFNLTGGRDLLAGWNLLWSILAVTALAAVGIQVYRKWSGERPEDLRPPL